MLRFDKIIKWLMTMSLLTGIILLLTCGRGIAAEISTSDLREIMTDTRTLLSENAELKQQIISERQAHEELIKELRSYQEVTKEQIALLTTQNALLSEEVTTLKKKLSSVTKRSTFWHILSLGAGIGIGCLF